MFGLAGTKWRRTATTILPVLMFGMSIAGLPRAAHAQFFGGWGGWGNGGGFWGGGMGPGEVYQAISERGFRVIAPLRRNGAVFVADVVDRRGRRERLIVAAADGEILQRFLIEGRGFPDYAPRRAARSTYDDQRTTEQANRGDLVPPGSIPGINEGREAPPAFVPVKPKTVLRPPRPSRPRIVERSPEPSRPQREDAPMQVVPPAPRPKPIVPHSPAAVPAATANRSNEAPPKFDAGPPTRSPGSTPRMSDPLRIPGGEDSPPPKRASEPVPKASAAAAPAPKPVPGTVTGAPVSPQPTASPPAAPTNTPADVPAAPLD